MRLLDTWDIADFIARNYTLAEKIIEVGVGAYPWVAQKVKENLPDSLVVVTDTDREKLSHAQQVCSELTCVQDNILKPNLKVYAGADLIYSLRPPPELVSGIFTVALRVGCAVLIRPLSHEEDGYDFKKRQGWRLISHGRAILHWYSQSRLLS